MFVWTGSTKVQGFVIDKIGHKSVKVRVGKETMDTWNIILSFLVLLARLTMTKAELGQQGADLWTQRWKHFWKRSQTLIKFCNTLCFLHFSHSLQVPLIALLISVTHLLMHGPHYTSHQTLSLIEIQRSYFSSDVHNIWQSPSTRQETFPRLHSFLRNWFPL